MILKEIKTVSKYALELDIDSMNIFRGYKGDTVLKAVGQKEAIDKIEIFATNMGLYNKRDYEIKYSGDGGFHSIFIAVVDEETFQLKGWKD